MPQEKIRVNLEVSPAVRVQILRLQDEIGATSQAEVFRKALNLLDLFVANDREGGIMLMQDDAGTVTKIKLI